MAFDAYMKFDGIPGESTDDKHKDWIEITSLQIRADQPTSASASTSGGATAERVNLSTLDVSHLMDKASPKLFEAACTGKHFKDVTIELCRAGGDKMKYLEIKLESVVVSKVDLSGSAQGEGTFPTEKLSIGFGKIKFTYTQQKRADGLGGGNVSGGWDQTANKVIA